MNKEQLVNLIMIPTLREIPYGLTTESVQAITMIWAHESLRGYYLKQVDGPALGPINMEHKTYNATWNWGESIWRNALKLGIISQHDFDNKVRPPFDRLIYDLRFNVFMCRQRLFMKPEKFPKTAYQMSGYLKRFWNSTKGEADSNSYLRDYELWR